MIKLLAGAIPLVISVFNPSSAIFKVYFTHSEITITTHVDGDVVARNLIITIVPVSDVDVATRPDSDASAVELVVLIERSVVGAIGVFFTCRPQRKPVLLVMC